MSPHLSQLHVAMAHRNYFRQNYLRILKLATHKKIEDRYCGCKLATFLIGKDGQIKCSYFILSKQTSSLLICNENKEICVANLIEVFSSKEYIFWGLRSEWVNTVMIILKSVNWHNALIIKDTQTSWKVHVSSAMKCKHNWALGFKLKKQIDQGNVALQAGIQ